jgi:hypothetical protein
VIDRTPVPPVPSTGHTGVAQRAPDPGPETGQHTTAAGESVGVSATVVGFDGVVIGSVTRHREAGLTGPALWQELVVVSVAGDLDADTGPLLHTALTAALDVNPMSAATSAASPSSAPPAPTRFWPRICAPPRRAASSPYAVSTESPSRSWPSPMWTRC